MSKLLYHAMPNLCWSGAAAAALTGDTTKSRQSYRDFLALWKDADADLPVLIEARKESEKIK